MPDNADTYRKVERPTGVDDLLDLQAQASAAINSLSTTSPANTITVAKRDSIDGAGLGANCHFKNAAVPVVVVTDLDGKIIISNGIVDDAGVTLNPADANRAKSSQWLASGARVLSTRFWAASTASVVLVAAFSQTEVCPSLPQEIGIEREICVWLGYIESVRPVVPGDLENGNLCRVFVGVIDNVVASGSGNGGVTVQLQCRCRMKWLMDSTIFFNPKELDKVAPVEGKPGQLKRSLLLLTIAQRAIGQAAGAACLDCGKNILKSDKFTVDIEDGRVLDADAWYTGAGDLAPLVGKVTTALKVPENPEFRIFTTRAALLTQEGANFLINQQTGIEVIKYLALQEVYPTEVFQDARDGNLYYAPRANDISGFSDPKRFYRTYYFGGAPASANVNQRLLGFKEEHSSIGLKTNIIVDKSAPMADGTAQNDWSLHLRVKPASLRGVKFACKFIKVTDPSIQTLSEASAIALSTARVWGKETRAGMAVILGDPSIVPGEVIQIAGSPLVPNGGRDTLDADRQRFVEYNDRYKANIKTYAESSWLKPRVDQDNKTSTELPVYDGTTAKFQIPTDAANPNDLLCKLSSQVIGADNAVGFNDDPATIFRCEAVLHRCNVGGKGYQVELALVSPF